MSKRVTQFSSRSIFFLPLILRLHSTGSDSRAKRRVNLRVIDRKYTGISYIALHAHATARLHSLAHARVYVRVYARWNDP